MPLKVRAERASALAAILSPFTSMRPAPSFTASACSDTEGSIRAIPDESTITEAPEMLTLPPILKVPRGVPLISKALASYPERRVIALASEEALRKAPLPMTVIGVLMAPPVALIIAPSSTTISPADPGILSIWPTFRTALSANPLARMRSSKSTPCASAIEVRSSVVFFTVIVLGEAARIISFPESEAP